MDDSKLFGVDFSRIHPFGDCKGSRRISVASVLETVAGMVRSGEVRRFVLHWDGEGIVKFDLGVQASHPAETITFKFKKESDL